MRVSIITPIYKGIKYIPALINQVELCKCHAGNDIDIEFILSNDDPHNSLDNYQSEQIDIVVLNTDVNRGIQGARIKGLSVATGEYIVFLDQDDIIYPNYVISQLRAIGDGAAVVCRYIDEGKLRYNFTENFEKLITKDYMLSQGNSIVSTGPVLIRKECIPEFWKENILKTSGADDYFLWLCMFAKGYSFRLNQDVLYERIVNGINTSLNTQRMINSEHEMFDVIKTKKLFKDVEDRVFDELEIVIRQKHIKILDRFRLMFFALNNLLILQENSISLSECLNNMGIKNLAIYGAGHVGRRIYRILQNTEVDVSCYVDQNAEYINEDVPAYTINSIPKNVDGVLVTILQGVETVMFELIRMYPDIKIIELSELLNYQEINTNEKNTSYDPADCK